MIYTANKQRDVSFIVDAATDVHCLYLQELLYLLPTCIIRALPGGVTSDPLVAMAPYKILKQGYMEKEPPLSKRGLRKVPACTVALLTANINLTVALAAYKIPYKQGIL